MLSNKLLNFVHMHSDWDDIVVMRAAVPIPALASASVVHSAAVGGSVIGVVRPL